jgi:GGDEF domain-containing protein
VGTSSSSCWTASRAWTKVVGAGHRVARELGRPFCLNGPVVDVSISVGASIGIRGRATATRALEKADAAMDAVKRRDGLLHPADIARIDH